MSDERDWVAGEIVEVEDRRARMAAARAKHPELDHWKTDQQLAILDRQLTELRELAA